MRPSSTSRVSRVRAGFVLVALAAIAAGTPSAPCPRGLRYVTRAGKKLVYLNEVARVYNLRLRKAGQKNLSLSSRWSRLLFRENSRELTFNGVRVWLNAPLYRAGWRHALDYADACWTLDPLLRRYAHLQRLRCRRVVLDPGHGGRDRGARGRRGVEEKAVVLDIARRVRVHVANAGLKVYLTRESDRYLSLDERVKKAARWNADLFVSIHANATVGRRGRGTMATAGAAATAYIAATHGTVPIWYWRISFRRPCWITPVHPTVVSGVPASMYSRRRRALQSWWSAGSFPTLTKKKSC